MTAGGRQWDVRNLALESAVVLCSLLAGRGLGFALTWLVAAHLGATGLGRFTIAWTAVILLGEGASLGLGQGAVLFLARRHGEPHAQRAIIARLLRWAPLGAVVFGVGLATLSEFIAHAIGAPEVADDLRLVAPAVAGWGILWVLIGALQGLGAVIAYGLVLQVLVPATLLGAGLAALLGTSGLRGVLGALDLAVLVGLAAAGLTLWRRAPVAGGSSAPTRGAAGLLRFSIPEGGTLVLVRLAWLLDIPMLALLGAVSDVGVFRVLLSLAMPLMILPNALMAVFKPQAAAMLREGERQRLRSVLERATHWVACGVTAIALGLFLLRDVVLALFGPDFAGAGLPLAVMLVGLLIQQISHLADALIPMSGRAGLNLGNTVAFVLLHLVLDVALIPTHGVLGAAIATAVSCAVLGCWRLFLVKRLFGVFPISRHSGAILLLGVGLALLGQRAPHALGPFGEAFLMLLLFGAIAWRITDRSTIDAS